VYVSRLVHLQSGCETRTITATVADTEIYLAIFENYHSKEPELRVLRLEAREWPLQKNRTKLEKVSCIRLATYPNTISRLVSYLFSLSS